MTETPTKETISVNLGSLLKALTVSYTNEQIVGLISKKKGFVGRTERGRVHPCLKCSLIDVVVRIPANQLVQFINFIDPDDFLVKRWLGGQLKVDGCFDLLCEYTMLRPLSVDSLVQVTTANFSEDKLMEDFKVFLESP